MSHWRLEIRTRAAGWVGSSGVQTLPAQHRRGGQLRRGGLRPADQSRRRKDVPLAVALAHANADPARSISHLALVTRTPTGIPFSLRALP